MKNLTTVRGGSSRGLVIHKKKCVFCERLGVITLKPTLDSPKDGEHSTQSEHQQGWGLGSREAMSPQGKDLEDAEKDHPGSYRNRGGQ